MLETGNMPSHVAFIMDGNGRWAKEKGLMRTAGHRAGIERVKEVVKVSQELGIKAVTFFAFSTENWQRPKNEISVLMRLLENFLASQIKVLHKNNMRFKVIGRDQPIPKFLLDKIRAAEEKTKNNSGLSVVLALNYGSRQEIVDAVKKITGLVLNQEMALGDINEDTLNRYLYTAGLPDPDLLIRTSGEVRLSNFLLWQLSYAELYFSKIYWPDFKREEFEKALKVYQNRERRFGKIDVDKENN